MTNVIITGHGGYATSVRNCLAMLLGETPGMFYVDFNAEDNLETLGVKLHEAMEQCKGEHILFACDLTGGSPFKQCAMLCAENPGHITVAGLNMAAYAETAYNLDLSVSDLADMAIETTHAAVLRFPEKQ